MVILFGFLMAIWSSHGDWGQSSLCGWVHLWVQVSKGNRRSLAQWSEDILVVFLGDTEWQLNQMWHDDDDDDDDDDDEDDDDDL